MLDDIDCDFDLESDRHRQAFWPGDTLRMKEYLSDNSICGGNWLGSQLRTDPTTTCRHDTDDNSPIRVFFFLGEHWILSPRYQTRSRSVLVKCFAEYNA